MFASVRVRRRGFTLVELVLVVVIISVIAAIAIPRLTFGRERTVELNLKMSLRNLRQAIDMYAAEHGGNYPAQTGGGDAVFPPGGSGTIMAHLTWSSNVEGEVVEFRDDAHPYGPYLDKIPVNPVLDEKEDAIYCSENFGTPGMAPGFGWEYETLTGRIRANVLSFEVGSNGVPYFEW